LAPAAFYLLCFIIRRTLKIKGKSKAYKDSLKDLRPDG
jgi:hypothetical protein